MDLGTIFGANCWFDCIQKNSSNQFHNDVIRAVRSVYIIVHLSEGPKVFHVVRMQYIERVLEVHFRENKSVYNMPT